MDMSDGRLPPLPNGTFVFSVVSFSFKAFFGSAEYANKPLLSPQQILFSFLVQ